MRRILGVVVAATIMSVGIAVGIGPGTPALADSVNTTQCSTSGGYTVCEMVRGAENTVYTPSGREIVVFNGTIAYTTYDANNNLVFSDSQDEHSQAVYAPNGTPVQEAGYRYVQTLTTPNGSCALTVDFHYAHGTFQFSTDSNTCV